MRKDYGLAIRQNTITKATPTDQDVDKAVYKMKKNIIASLNHNIKSPDPTKQHRFCPPGETSWCKWQQDLATCTLTYKGDNCLPEVFLDVLKPIYMNLSETNLLRRCVHGATQNSNESINALVWIRCPKHKHHGATAVQCAAASAVCHFHCGASIREQIMEKLLVPAGKHTKKASHTKDKKRVAQSDLRATQREKKRHQGQQLLNVRREEALKDAEGVTYEAGAFNE